jgi:hypothetical protein
MGNKTEEWAHAWLIGLTKVDVVDEGIFLYEINPYQLNQLLSTSHKDGSSPGFQR